MDETTPLTTLDKLIGYFFPTVGLKRQAARFALAGLSAFDAANSSRHTRNWIPLGSTGDTDTRSRSVLRNKAWDLFRNSPYCVSATNAVVARITSRLIPESQAVSANGEPDTSFRERARTLWNRWGLECDTKGFPGQGGATIDQIFEQILRETILSGEVLIHFNRLTRDEADSLNLTIPLTLTVIEADRLNDAASPSFAAKGNQIYQGIELTPDGRRAAYHVCDRNPNDPLNWSLNSKRIPAEDVLHIFLPGRPGQLRGYSWFACCLDSFRMISELQYSELVAARINACLSAVITQKEEFGGVPNMQTPTGRSSVDADGNRMLWTQPGLLPVLPPGQNIESYDSKRPNVSIDDFIRSLLRGIAGAFPLKASQLHNDYRESSFSSEASNENDLMPEILSLHSWFTSAVCRPIYETLILTARASGHFNGFDDEPLVDAYTRKLTEATYPLPESRSINKLNDIMAAWARVKMNVSSVPDEAAKLGNDWVRIIEANKQYLDMCKAVGMPDAFSLSTLGIPIAPQQNDQQQDR